MVVTTEHSELRSIRKYIATCCRSLSFIEASDNVEVVIVSQLRE